MKAFISLLILQLFSSAARAYPELARHGYPNCIACHVSPSGGGVLTEYGRSLSKELLSTWGNENEELLGHGLFAKPPEWLLLGGDFQWVQVYRNDPSAISTKNFWMRNELEAAVKLQKFYVDASFGIQRGPSETPHLYDSISSKHYVGYYLSDEFSLRFGKFLPAYGIYTPNHNVFTRDNLGLGIAMERLNFEAAYMGEKFDFFLTAMLGRADVEGMLKDIASDPSFDEHGLVVSSSLWLVEKFKVGASALYATSNDYARKLAGIFAILKLSSQFYLQSEYDWQSKVSTSAFSAEQRGPAFFNQLAYQAHKGLDFYLIQEEAYLDLNTLDSRDDIYGAGFRFYPRPHLEFQGEFHKERNMAQFADYYDYAFLMAHYYF